jgi:hypothetical protein
MVTAKALGFGIEEDSVEAVKMLLELGLDVNAVEGQGATGITADPPRLETVTLRRKLMGEDPNAPLPAPLKTR